MEDREKDIQELCKQVLHAAPASHYNPNGADWSRCPFCFGEVRYMDADINEITHIPDCAYLIAKDLTTNLK